ncbi:hypothetical protein [Kosakonia radicincitans]|uniref:hypothetical protein n=1 Tax=Kosakonia radicincitans TaxID=283686 RepID=UPI000690A0F6|nr:hypothetical protein [Kosakonia radicincitans]
MNIESVKKLIASLEAAGELTIKERIYLYSMKEHIALAAENAALSAALTDIIAERQRQQSVEGWTPEHDDKHINGEMAFAAASYAFHAAAAMWDLEDCGTEYDSHPAPKNWPWEPEWWKPTTQRRDLVKAAALIAAEIERIDRAARKSEQVKGVQS